MVGCKRFSKNDFNRLLIDLWYCFKFDEKNGNIIVCRPTVYGTVNNGKQLLFITYYYRICYDKIKNTQYQNPIARGIWIQISFFARVVSVQSNKKKIKW
jgi:hypothetical protein